MNNFGSISQLNTQLEIPKPEKNKVTPGEAQNQFANSLKNAIEQVNRSQVESNQKTEALANGDMDNLHDVMVTAKKASITLQATTAIQGKVIDAYKEIMRMQV